MLIAYNFSKGQLSSFQEGSHCTFHQNSTRRCFVTLKCTKFIFGLGFTPDLTGHLMTLPRFFNKLGVNPHYHFILHFNLFPA